MTINTHSPISIGFNARLFPENWRPARQEITFAQDNNFQTIQLPGPPDGLGKERLGDDLPTTAQILQDANITAVMEIVIHLQDNGRTKDNKTPFEILKANLPAITTLPCPYVHWHLVSIGTLEPALIRQLEKSFLPQFIEAVQIAQDNGFKFSLEHNEPDLMLFSKTEHCQELLDQVPGLGFVWDFNHTTPEDLSAIQTLIPFMNMLHISDTPLPEVNHHLPLGLGTINIEAYCRALIAGGFRGPAILEIGGHPKSGGFGQDTDKALIHTHHRLHQAIQKATTGP